MTQDEFEERALQALAGARLEPLPEGLHEALLMDAARTSEARGGHPARTSWLSFVTAALQVRPAYALGGAVAAGIAIGALGLGLVLGASGGQVARSLAPATTASLPPRAPTREGAAITRLDRGDVHVELTTRREGGGLIVRVDGRGADSSELTLAWDPAQFRLAGVRFEASSSPVFETEAGHARLPVPLATGCELSLSEIAPGGSALRVTLSSANGEQEEALRLPR